MVKNIRKRILENAKAAAHSVKILVKWLFLGSAVGVIVGGVASLFGHVLIAANALRTDYPWIVFGLPFGGLVIALLYHKLGSKTDRGTNTIIASIHSGERIPFRMAPLIFVSTLITHLFGGSAGREGAALQLGGSIAGKLGGALKMNENSRSLMVMCGMSAAFSALFGTPLAAAVFSMEVVSIGIMHYSALVPCVTASLVGHFVAVGLQVPPEVFPVAHIPEMTPLVFIKIVLFAAVVGGVSVLFCLVLHGGEHFYHKYLKNRYLRIFVGGSLVVLLSALLGTDLYLGSGMGIIEEILHHGESIAPWVFLLKMLFTAITLGAGFKGGEIVPSFAIGAAFGCTAAALMGLPMELAAACGMVGVFCGVTNSPITSLLISFELFGFEAMPYYLVTIAVSYMLSGLFGLYREQRIVNSKTEMKVIDAKVR